MKNSSRQCFTFAVIALALAAGPLPAQDTQPLLNKIRAVDKEGKGAVAAAQAWHKLTQQSPDALIDILAAMKNANPTAENYLRSAFETLADRHQGKLPEKKLRAFLADTQNGHRARRLAYELLKQVDATIPQRLLPKMIDDPSPELRRDAVARLLVKSKELLDAKKKDAAKAAYQKALQFARDSDQVQEIAKRLKPMGIEVDLTKHFGFITAWRVIAPFDSKGGVGYAKTYPPDQKVDLSATYSGQDGKAAKWIKHQTNKAKGIVDFNDVYGDWHGVVGYAYTIVESKQEQPVEIRAQSNNAVKIYLNGKEIYSREEYHHGVRMDQHVGKGVLRAGRNEILIKVCQNEQTDVWAQQWSFNLRVTDHLGAPVPLRVVAP